MVGLSISVSDSAALGSLEGFKPGAIKRIQREGNNTTARQAAKKAASIGKKLAGLTQLGDAQKMVGARYAGKGSTQASVRISHRPMNLIRFVAGQKPPKRRPRVGVKAKPYGKPRVHRGAFFMPLKGKGSGRWAVMKRSGRERLPIEPLFGPSLYQIFKDDSEAHRELERFIAERHPINMRRAIDRERRAQQRGINRR